MSKNAHPQERQIWPRPPLPSLAMAIITFTMVVMLIDVTNIAIILIIIVMWSWSSLSHYMTVWCALSFGTNYYWAYSSWISLNFPICSLKLYLSSFLAIFHLDFILFCGPARFDFSHSLQVQLIYVCKNLLPKIILNLSYLIVSSIISSYLILSYLIFFLKF